MANPQAIQEWRQKKIEMGFDPSSIDAFIEEQRANVVTPQAQTQGQQIGQDQVSPPVEIGVTGAGINQPFGNPNVELYGISPSGQPNINRGVDLASQAGEKQYAPTEGNWVVESAVSDNSWNQGWGNSVVVKNTDTGETIRNSHLDEVYVEPGENVTGKPLGNTGTTGRTTGAHKDIEYTTPEGQLADAASSPYAGEFLQSRPPPPKSEDLTLLDTQPETVSPSATIVETPPQPEKPEIMSRITPSPSTTIEPVPTSTPGIEPTPKPTSIPDIQGAEMVEGTPDTVAPIVQEVSKKYGVPADLMSAQLKAESSFDPNAVSHAGAAGIAQFIPSTAKSYGLKVDDKIDERLDPAKAIDAQGRYMKDLLDQYGSTERALSAYNSGKPDAYLNPSFARGETYNYVRKIMSMIQ